MGALSGVRVVDWTTMAAGPGGSALLADAGASVLKVEPVKGDPWRKVYKGAPFNHDNRGKQSIALDLRNPAGIEVMHALLSKADVLVTNVRVSSVERLGLDYDKLKSRYPRLIFAHLSAWGRRGPMRNAPGYDAAAFWAASGLLDIFDVSGDSDQHSLPQTPDAAGDHTTSLSLFAGIALALFERERTGLGRLVDVSLLGSGIWCNAMPLIVDAAGKATMRKLDRNGPTYRPYRCKDGICLQLLGYQQRRHAPNLRQALGLAQLPEDLKEIDAIFKTKTAAEWETLFDETGVWYTRINKYDKPGDVFLPSSSLTPPQDRGNMSRVAEQSQSIGAVVLDDKSNLVVASPIRFGGEPAPTLRASPALGADTVACLKECGMSQGEIEQLEKRGAFGENSAKMLQSNI